MPLPWLMGYTDAAAARSAEAAADPSENTTFTSSRRRPRADARITTAGMSSPGRGKGAGQRGEDVHQAPRMVEREGCR